MQSKHRTTYLQGNTKSEKFSGSFETKLVWKVRLANRPNECHRINFVACRRFRMFAVC